MTEDVRNTKQKNKPKSGWTIIVGLSLSTIIASVCIDYAKSMDLIFFLILSLFFHLIPPDRNYTGKAVISSAILCDNS